jgi:hypothetical protein
MLTFLLLRETIFWLDPGGRLTCAIVKLHESGKAMVQRVRG